MISRILVLRHLLIELIETRAILQNEPNYLELFQALNPFGRFTDFEGMQTAIRIDHLPTTPCRAELRTISVCQSLPSAFRAIPSRT
jgi:hypothetical protein